MSLEERTLVVRNIDGDRLSEELLEELFSNFGPVVKVVLRKNFAFIEFTAKVSVGYAWAMTDGLCLQGRQLRIAPKLDDDPSYYSFRDALQAFEQRIERDTPYLESLLTAEQRQERQALINGLEAGSANVITRVQRRLRQYELHVIPKSTYNAVIRRDLANLSRNNRDSNKMGTNEERFNDSAKYLNRGHQIYQVYDSPPQQHQQHRRSQSLDGGHWSRGAGNHVPDSSSEYQYDYPLFRPPPSSRGREVGGYYQQQQYGHTFGGTSGGSQPNLSQYYHQQQPPPLPHGGWHHQGPLFHPPPPDHQHHQNNRFVDSAADPYSVPYFEQPPFTPLSRNPPAFFQERDDDLYAPIAPHRRPPTQPSQNTGPSYHHLPLPQSTYSPEFEPRAPSPPRSTNRRPPTPNNWNNGSSGNRFHPY